MAIRPIVKWGEGVLHAPSAPVPAITDDIKALLDDMHETMIAAPGIGLAAPQIGVSLRVIIVDLSVGEDPAQLIELVNPEFVSRDGMQLEDEGCLSLPGFNAIVPRPLKATVRGLDRTGQSRVIEGTGLLARALQHEIDHLDGVLFLERLRGLKRDLIKRRIRKLQRTGKW